MSEFIQGSSEWLEMRKKYVMASDTPIICGVSKWKLADGRIKTPYLLWQEKMGLTVLNSDTPSTRFGKENEVQARYVYEAMTENFVSPEVIFHKDIPYMGCSLDGLTIDKSLAVEIKCINKEDHELARKGLIPEHYKPQVYHQLECLGHDFMHYFSYHNHEGIIVTVHKDEQYQSYIKQKVAEFWECMQTFTSPPLTEHDYIEMSSEWEALAKDMFKLKEIIKTYQMQYDFIEEQLKEMCDGKSSMAGNYRYCKSFTKGRVDYSIIPELNGVDLELYRKKPTETWRLSAFQKE